MTNILESNPILLLFVVASLGYLVGSIKIRGGSLGGAAVLFVGLVFGALNPEYQIPDIIFLLGLSIFVYSIGLSSGPAFFNSYRTNGIRDFIFIVTTLFFSALVAVLLFFLWDFSAAAITGLYTGSTTNTAAMAGVIEYINSNPKISNSQFTLDVAVGYTYSYPMGVIGSMVAIILMEKIFKIDYKEEINKLRNKFPGGKRLTSATVEILHSDLANQSLRELFKKHDWDVIFGRLATTNGVQLCHWDIRFEVGDLVMVVGSKEEIAEVAQVLGREVESQLSYDRRHFDVRRIFLSNPDYAGKTVAALNIHERYNVVITRIRRGDVDILAKGDTILELGDRVRLLGSRKDLHEISKEMGDSYQESSSINLFSFGLGIGLGLVVGAMELRLSPDISIKLGYAGGPLVVGLLLGTIRRTGPVVWTLPYGANVTLQQIGLILLLSAIGVKSGNAFIASLSSQGLEIFVAGAIVSIFTALFILGIGYKFLKLPFTFLMGMVSNQPAILEFARNRSGSRIPDYGFSMVFPIALILKVIIAQLLFIILNGL